MSKSTIDLQAIMRAGGSVSIPSSKSTIDLQAIARAGGDTGATLIIRSAEKKSTVDLQAIARANPGHVIFEFE